MHLRSAKEDKHQHQRAVVTLETETQKPKPAVIHEIEKINFDLLSGGNAARGEVTAAFHPRQASVLCGAPWRWVNSER